MKIGIIGSGNIGATLAQLFEKAGHQVEISNSRGPASLNALVQSIGSDNVLVNLKVNYMEELGSFFL